MISLWERTEELLEWCERSETPLPFTDKWRQIAREPFVPAEGFEAMADELIAHFRLVGIYNVEREMREEVFAIIGMLNLNAALARECPGMDGNCDLPKGHEGACR